MRWNGWIGMGCAVVGVYVVGVGDIEAQLPPVPGGATAVAQGLFGPRGLKFGPDGNLYVALSGTGGADNTINNVADGCMSPAGPFANGNTASIVKVDGQGNVTTVASGFASAFSAPTQSILGVADVAFLDGELYAVTSGGGCSHGSAQPNMIAKVDTASGNWSMVADMSAAVRATPAATTDPGDYTPDGVFYNLIGSKGKLFAVESNHGQIWSVTQKGDVEMVTDVSAVEGIAVPTAAVESDGGLLVGTLGRFPITPDSSQVLTLRPGCGGGTGYQVEACGPGMLHISAAGSPGLTTVVSMAWGLDGLLYVLELSDAAGFPTPGAGKVVRVRNGVAEDVITGLSVPTGMTFGPDGALYVSNWGAAPAPIGQILRYNVQ